MNGCNCCTSAYVNDRFHTLKRFCDDTLTRTRAYKEHLHRSIFPVNIFASSRLLVTEFLQMCLASIICVREEKKRMQQTKC